MKKAYISHKLKKLPERAFLAEEKDLENLKNPFIILQSFQDDHYEIFFFPDFETTRKKIWFWIDQKRCWLCYKKVSKDKKQPLDKADKLTQMIAWGF